MLVHLYFSGVYTDGDQTITWLSAVDKADGRWYTPYFYGQFYNISITAIVSSPFIRFGFPVEYVVPIITNVLGLIPFLFGAWYLTRIKQNKAAIIVLCMGIILPAQYHFVTAMARGFVGGITVLSIGLLLTSAKPALIKGLGYGLCIIAYFVNPNMLIIGLPLALLWGLQSANRYKAERKLQVTPVLIGLTIAVIAFFAINAFNSPLYEVHKLWKLELGFGYLQNSLKSLDARFLYLFPFLPKIGSLSMAVLVILIVVLFVQKQSKSAVLMTLVVLFVLATLSLNKTLDGTYSTFFPFSRMYLALPYVLVLGVSLTIQHVSYKRLKKIILVVGVIGFICQCFDIPKKAKASVQGNSGVVQVLRIDKLCAECVKLNKIQQDYKADVTVFHYKTDEYIYGCKALQPEMETLYPEYDRRYWTFMQHADTIYETVLFMDWSLRLPEQLKQYNGDFNAIDGIHYPAFILTDNSQSIIDLYTINSLPLRPYKK